MEELSAQLASQGQSHEAAARQSGMGAPTPSVVGVVLPEVHLSLSLLDVKGCFVTAQKETSAGRAKAVDAERLILDDEILIIGPG